MSVMKIDLIKINSRVLKISISTVFLIFLVSFSALSQTITSVTPVNPDEICVGETVTINGSSLGTITKVVFKDDTLLLEDGSIIVTASTITFPAPATAITVGFENIYTKIYIDPNGMIADDSLSSSIKVNSLPSDPANPVPGSYCAGDPLPSITVDDPGDGFTVKWYTTLGGNTPAAGTVTGNNGEIFTPMNDQTANYFPEIENDDTGCVSLNRLTIQVIKYPLPASPTNPVSASYCGGDPIPSVSVADPTAGFTVKWYEDLMGSTPANGITSGNNEEIFTPANDVSASYFAEVENDGTGCTSSSRIELTVTRNPIPSNPANPISATYCSGDPIPSVRVNDPGNGLTVKWFTSATGSTLATGTSGGNNGEIFTPTSGITATYYAEVENDVTLCTSASRAGATITRNAAPANAVNPINARYCAGDPIPSVRVNDPGNGLTVKWYTALTGGTLAAGTSGGNNGEIFTPSADATATYYAGVENDVTNCTSLARVGVTITKNPLPADAANPLNSEYCAGDPIAPVRVNDPGNGLTVKWYTNTVDNTLAAGTPSGNNGEIFTPANDATATYYAEVENDITGCTSPSRVAVTVIKLPAPFLPSNPVNGVYCAGDPIPSIRVADPGPGFTIAWFTTATGSTLAAGVVNGNNGEIFTPTSGATATYYAEVQADDTGCGSLSRVAVTLTRNPLPPNAANPVDNTYCPGKALPTISVDNPGAGLTVKWYTTATGTTLAPGVTGGLNGEQFTPTTPGTATYYAEVENDNTSCISASRTGVDVIEDPNSCTDTEILSFSFNEQKGSTTINKTTRTITLAVRYGTSLTSLIASFTLSAGASAKVNGVAQQSGVTANNFTNDVIYAVTAADGVTTQNWTVSVSVALNDATDFLTYSMAEQAGPATINTTNHTIGLNVLYGTSLTNLVASFTVSAGAVARVGNVVQQSGVTANNFTNPLTYRVTAQDGTRQDWVVTVKEAANDEADFLVFDFSEASGDAMIDLTAHTVDIGVVYGTDPTDLVATFTLSAGATARISGVLQQSGITSNDFTNDVIYTVTAGDLVTTQNWTVSVEVDKNDQTEIVSYSFPEQTKLEINSGTNIITAEVAPGTDLTDLVAYFTLSPGAVAEVNGVEQVSGVTANDFTDTLTYTITAENGTTTENWYVAVTEQDILDNEPPVIVSGKFPDEYPVENDSLISSVVVTDNIGVGRVVFRYKEFQETEWNEMEASRDDSLFTYYIREPFVGSHGMSYYFKAYDFKDNSDSTVTINMVLRYNEYNSPEIPGLVFGGTVGDYQILSLPMTLANNNVNQVFNELMPYNIKKWRLFHYNNGITGEYIEDFSTLAAGKGYWLIIRDQADIQVGAGTTTKFEDESGFAITLQPGWNQVGNPYAFGVSWDDVRLFNSNPNVGQIKLYNNGLLQEGDQVPAFRGGFVFLGGDQSAFINVPPNPGFKNNRIAGGNHIAGENNIDAPAWYLPLEVVHGMYRNAISGIGMNPESDPGFDPYDEPLLPVPGEISGFEMYFPHQGEKYEKIARDIVPSSDYHMWEFTVDKYGESGNISLAWDNDYFGDNEYILILVDEANDRMIDLRATDSYTFFASGVHKFKIYYGLEDRLAREIIPTTLEVGDIYPNPFNEELFIPLSLPDIKGSYLVEITLSDLNGNRIQQFSNLTLGAGYQRIQCDLKQNLNYSKGFYIVRILISSGDRKEIMYRKVLKF